VTSVRGTHTAIAVECRGLYRFDVDQVVDLDERKTLTEQDG